MTGDDRSERLAPYLRLVRAPNPGPMTLTGTNTWVVGDPDRGAPVVIDPGPAVPTQLEAVLQACGGRVQEVVLTHRHADHAELAAELATRAGCGVRAAEPGFQLGSAGLVDEDRLEVAGARLVAYATPGHTSDSFSLLVLGEDGTARLATGDTVLGSGTTVIAAPDGDLGDYLASLTRLEALVREHGVGELLPGHGPVVSDPAARLASYRAHRLQRLEQVRAAFADGLTTPAEVVARVYAGVDPAVRPAAEHSVAAQLAYLSREAGPTS